MPFTISHVAASLPFLRRSQAVGWKAAVIFGTMAPDLMFPIPYFGERDHTHSLKGLFALDVPFAFCMAVVWIFVISRRVSRLPGLHSLGKHDLAAFSIPMTLLGALVGCSTHLGWDLFTHAGSPLLNHPIFYQPLIHVHNGAIFVLQAIWYLNSLLGGVVLLWWLRRQMHRQGNGVRAVFFTGPWLRIYAAFLFPYGLILLLLLRGRPNSVAQVMVNLVYMVDLVRVGMLVSLVTATAIAWWETRKRKLESPLLGPAANPMEK